MSILCDLVLQTWNRPDLLIPCVERILQHTTIPSRLLIVDNASTDPEALAFLERVQGTSLVTVEVVRRAANDGFGKGMNDGLRRTTAPWICLLNNDIVVTVGWLEELLAVAQANPAIGALNPMSNEFNIEPAAPRETVDELAGRLQSHHGQWLENWACVGFCFLFSREVFQQVGYFDEGFEFMYAEDKDYSLRIRQFGRLCAIAEGAYVYHHVGSTARNHPKRWDLFARNEERLHRKWNLTPSQRIAYLLASRAAKDTARERIRQLANQGHRVWVFYAPDGHDAIPRHFQVVPQRLGRFGFWPRAMGRILFKKKKFHQVIRG
ncbi:MAG: glycosyltransferase family 2 protein [Candidatus Omnitrophica bacterium]|nr:glycosyltransferase family 2 protein [Candidatus Omnitrophota bacterium]